MRPTRGLFQLGVVTATLAVASCRSSHDAPNQDAGADAAQDAGADRIPQTVRPHATVVATTGAEAIAEGMAVLREGGSAVDGALTVAMDQIVLSGGCWNSFAGILGMVVYEASSGKVYALHAGYRTFAGEKDPLTIPKRPQPSGRSAMVPGFFAGVEAAHERFGALPFARLLTPAVRHATDGFVVPPMLGQFLADNRDVLTRLPAARAIYAPTGQLFATGDLFRQPALADTLRRIAAEGASYVYRGDWAAHFVEAVNAEGGHAAAADLAGYEPIWNDPICFDHADRRVCTFSGPDHGGVDATESFLVAQAADLPSLGDYAVSGAALATFVRASRVGWLMGNADWTLPLQPRYFVDRLPGIDPHFEARVTRAQAETMLGHIRSGVFDAAAYAWGTEITAVNAGSHSDAVVVVDAKGNAVAMTHTINTTTWGDTGIVVDGILLPDSASFQQGNLYLVGAGATLPNPLNPTIVLRDGAAQSAIATVGEVHYGLLSVLYGELVLGRGPGEIARGPWIAGNPYLETRSPAGFAATALTAAEALGVKPTVATDLDAPMWVAVSIAPDGSHDAGLTPNLAQFGGMSLTEAK